MSDWVEAVKAVFKKRHSCFVVKRNRADEWFYEEVSSNGKIKNVSESYASKYNAERAAKHKAEETPGATWKVID